MLRESKPQRIHLSPTLSLSLDLRKPPRYPRSPPPAAADASVLLRGGGAALLAGARVRPAPDRMMGAAGGGRCVRLGAAPVLVLLLIAAATLPRLARAVTDAGDGNPPCSARFLSHFLRLIVSWQFARTSCLHGLPTGSWSLACLSGWVSLFAR